MKIVLIGVVEFSDEILKTLVAINANIVGVLTKKNSNYNADFCDLSTTCNINKIDYLHFEKINDSECITYLKNKKPDIILCVGLSQIIRQEILEIPSIGVIGYHPSQLPMNRGRHPIIWAIALGLKQTGSTFFFMDKGADTGDILHQEIIQIEEKETAHSLYQKIIKTAKKQICEFIPQLETNNFRRIKQDNSQANYWRKRGKKDGLINFNANSITIDRLVRSLSKPYVGAHTVYNDMDIKVWEVMPTSFEYNNIEPGKVIEIDGKKIKIKTSDGAIWIVDHEFISLPEVGEYLS